jgi:cellulose synthase operon protein C
MNSFLRSSVILLALSLSGPAFGQDDRTKREERRALKMSEVDATTTMSEAYRQAAHEKRRESMKRAKEMLKGGQLTGESKAKVQFRLAEMYFEEGRYYYFNEMQEYQKIYDDCFNGIPAGCDVNKIEADHSESRKWQKNAIRLYDDILMNYPQYQRADEVLFYLGSAYQEIKEPDKAVKHFIRLTKEYSESEYIPGAFVQIGEYYFDRNNAYKALNAYKQAAKYKNFSNYGFAVYKLSWCYYNVGEYDNAIEGMKTVVRYSETQKASGDKKALTLQDEALKDLVRFFADAGDMQEAEDYFRGLGKEELYNKMLKRLASMYFEQGKFEQAIVTYRKLIAENADSPEAPNYQNEIITAYQKMGEKEQTLNEIQKLLQQYGKNSTWAAKNSANQDAVRKAQNYVEDSLRRVAVNYNNEAKKLGSGQRATDTFLLAEKAYRVYLQEFPDGKNSYDMRYAFAELIYYLAEKGRFDADTTEKYFVESYESYMKVVQVDNKGKYAEFCADAAIFAADELIKIDKKKGLVKERKGSTDIAPIEMSPWEGKKLTALEQYTTLFPDNKKTIEYIYDSGFLLFNKNQLDKASEHFRTVISMDPKSKQAMYAANLILGALDVSAQAKEEQKDYDGAAKDFRALRDTAQAFRDQEGLGNKSFKEEMHRLFELSSLKEINLIYDGSKKTNADKLVAADAYMGYASDFPESKKADLAIHNAAVYYYQLDNTKKSMSARHLLIEKYPKSEKYTEHVAELGFAYESIAKFDKAADWYEKLFETDKEYPSSKDALHRAAYFRESAGEYDLAIKNKLAYQEAYPEDERSIHMLIDIGNIQEKKGDIAKAQKSFYEYFSKPGPQASSQNLFYARLKYGEMLKKSGKDVNKHWKNTLTAYELLEDEEIKNDRFIKQVIEEVKYDLAYTATRNYYDLEISGPGSGRANQEYIQSVLTKQIKKKLEALGELETQFVEVAQMTAGKYTLAAIVEIGNAYDNYAETITNSYNIFADDSREFYDEGMAEIYQMQLEDQAYAYQEKATAAYIQALDFAFQYNVYTEATADATRRLGELRPDEFPELTESILSPEFLTAKEETRTFLEDAK